MIIVPYRAQHFDSIVLQEHQAFLQNTIAGSDYAKTLAGQEAYTGLVDGRAVVCAGISAMWPGRGIAWAYLARDAGRHFVAITRATRRLLDLHHGGRVECYVDAGFNPAIRWVELLGFIRETPSPMRKFTADGRDCYQYARYFDV